MHLNISVPVEKQEHRIRKVITGITTGVLRQTILQLFLRMKQRLSRKMEKGLSEKTVIKPLMIILIFVNQMVLTITIPIQMALKHLMIRKRNITKG